MKHTARLIVDRQKIVANYRILAEKAGKTAIAPVLKANAYGLGALPIGRALFDQGVRVFYSAHADESIVLKAALPEAEILSLHGPDHTTAESLIHAGVHVVLNDAEQVHLWRHHVKREGRELEAALHIHTGLNRLGIRLEELSKLMDDGAFEGIKITRVLSHLACSDQPDHSMNPSQAEAYKRLVDEFSGIKTSFCNSAGVFLGNGYLYDEARCGGGIYGIRLVQSMWGLLQPAARLICPMMSIRHAKAGEYVGYGATHQLKTDATLAILPFGYADGFPSRLSNIGTVHVTDGQQVYACKVVGRVSMDLTTIDVSQVPDMVLQRGWVEWFGTHQDIEPLAASLNMIEYEIYLNLGYRVEREYI